VKVIEGKFGKGDEERPVKASDVFQSLADMYSQMEDEAGDAWIEPSIVVSTFFPMSSAIVSSNELDLYKIMGLLEFAKQDMMAAICQAEAQENGYDDETVH